MVMDDNLTAAGRLLLLIDQAPRKNSTRPSVSGQHEHDGKIVYCNVPFSWSLIVGQEL
jgi:hypothetical protein